MIFIIKKNNDPIWTVATNKMAGDLVFGIDNAGIKVEAKTEEEAKSILAKNAKSVCPSWNISWGSGIAEKYTVAEPKLSTPFSGVCKCINCNMINPYAEPNLPDNKYKCYDCSNRWW